MKIPFKAWPFLLLLTHQCLASSAANKLFFNNSFEESQAEYLQHGTSENIVGWITEHSAYSGNQVLKTQSAPDGEIIFELSQGGRVETSPEGRAEAKPGKIYELRFSSKKVREKNPAGNHGILPSIDFYDETGKLLERIKGEKAQTGNVTDWEKITMQATAPANAARVGVRVFLDRGIIPDADTSAFQLDGFELVEMADGTANPSAVKK